MTKAKESRLQVTAGAALFYPLLLFLDADGWLAALLPAVICHELGHLLAVWACGGRLRSVNVQVFGLCMDITPFASRGEELLCTAAGPAAGLLWAAAAYHLPWSWGVRCSAASLVINLFNLLPAEPLDGGTMLYALTGSAGLLRVCSWCTAALLCAAAVRYRVWGALVPAALIVKNAVSP